MSDQSNRPQLQFSPAEGLLLIAGFMTVSVLFLVLVVVLKQLDSEILALPTLSIAGIVLLLISLAAIAYVFVRTGLQDPKQALGLPAGSIQAVIALSLIVLFAILSVFIFTSMGASAPRKIPGLSQVERDAQMAALSNGFAGWEKASDGTYTIYVRDPGLDARNDVGKQLIVLIGTLMTSAVSFYFGTRATEAGIDKAKRGAEGETANPGGAKRPAGFTVAPGTITPGAEPLPLKLTGDRVGKATAVSFRQAGKPGGATFSGAKLAAASDHELTCTVQPDASVAAGDYDAVLTIDGKPVVREKALKVLAAKPD